WRRSENDETEGWLRRFDFSFFLSWEGFGGVDVVFSDLGPADPDSRPRMLGRGVWRWAHVCYRPKEMRG
ncbi:hypothetical protein RB213_007663, partial [Colletotrichum asianum]